MGRRNKLQEVIGAWRGKTGDRRNRASGRAASLFEFQR